MHEIGVRIGDVDFEKWSLAFDCVAGGNQRANYC